MSQFKSAQFPGAINAFIELNINPAKVVALYPESIAGRLAVSEDDWIVLFGGPAKASPASETASTHDDSGGSKTVEDEPGQAEPAYPARPPSPHGSVRGLLKTGLDSLRASGKKEDDLETASVKAKKKECKSVTLFRSSDIKLT